jgi:hypothetical protein
MRWGPDTTGPFLAIAGIFLVLSSIGLYLLRNVMGRMGASAWSNLRSGSKFKTFEAQRKYSVLAAGVVGLAGLVLLFVAAIQ